MGKDVAHLYTVKTVDAAREQLEFLQNKLDCCLVIDGESLQVS
jgi:phospholipid-translocating ATPase